MNTRILLTATALASLLVATALTQAAAPKKVPGEKWKQTMSMEAAGMRMPAQTTEMCLPKDKGTNAASRPPQMDEKNCRIHDLKQSGNKTSAKMSCTGKDAMEGEFETTVLGPDHVSGQMRARREGMDMTMKFESQKLGGACEAIDFEALAASAQDAPAPQVPDSCAAMATEMGKGGGSLGAAAPYYVGEEAMCGKHASKKSYCDGVQSHAGYAALDRSERAMAGVTDARGNPASLTPLSSSVSSCGLGRGPAAVTALRTRLLASAEQAGQWGFMVEYGDAASFQRLGEIARTQCAGRSFTSAANPRYSGLCNAYGAALVRGDREAVRQIAAGNAPAEAGASAQAPAASAAGTQSAQPATQPAEAPKERAVDKGKRLLRGILGN